MFLIMYKHSIKTYNKEEKIEKKNDIYSISSEIGDCLLCFENKDIVFYDYKFKNNKYIHNCNCTPNLHYQCFKECFSKKESCIICLEKIDINKKCKYSSHFSKIKFTLFCLFIYLFIYTITFLNDKLYLLDDVI